MFKVLRVKLMTLWI